MILTHGDNTKVNTMRILTLATLFFLAACAPLGWPLNQPKPTSVAPVVIDTPVPATSTPEPTETQIPPTSTATYTPTPSSTPTPAYPLEGRGPTGFAANVDPLTGLEVPDPALLDRRPIVIKVENLPREHRPQWGLSLADLVFEYYTEFGATRFAAVFYGSDAERVGPIRSGRFFDVNVVQMYKGVFVYGSAYVDVQTRFIDSDFVGRLILETTNSCPALCRTDPNGQDLLVSDTSAMRDYLVKRDVDNSRQNLDGMFFKVAAPLGGSPAERVYLRYSGAIYNRWDYNADTGNYLRYVDNANDINRNNEVYVPLTDRITNKMIAAENVVTLCVPHQYYVKKEDAEVVEIIMDSALIGSYTGCDGKTYPGNAGAAYVARDGQLFTATWKRAAKDTVLTLLQADGTPFPLKPGHTWFEVVGASSEVLQQPDNSWRFVHHMVP